MEPKLDLSGGIPIVNLQEPDDTITLSSTTYNYPYGYDYSNVSVASGGSNTIPSITIASGTGITSPWTTTTAYPYLGSGISADGNDAGRIKLTGKNADIEVNGESLMGLLKEIRERLNLITINEKMEKEWEELHELGNQYRALEAKLKEQGEMWAKLKAMPAPDIK